MPKVSLPNESNRNFKSGLSQEKLERLRAEAEAPYRGLRQFFYLAFAASAFLGGFVFFFKVLAGQDLAATLPSLALQIGVFVLMVWLYRLEQR
jgi:hypothetical protein